MRILRRRILRAGVGFSTLLLAGCSGNSESGGGEDSDNDGVPDNEDDYPADFGKSTFYSNFRLSGTGTQSTEVDAPPGASIGVEISLGMGGGDEVTTMVFDREALRESDNTPEPTFRETVDATQGVGGTDDIVIPPDEIPRETAVVVFEPSSDDVEIEVKGSVYE